VVFLLLGALTLLVLMAALGMFSGAQVRTVKTFGVWVVALGGLVLAALLFFTGRGAAALGDLLMLGIVIWPWIQHQLRMRARGNLGAGFRPGTGAPPRPRGSGMSREEAFAVLGLRPGAGEEDIRAAHKRLMRMAHPDNGGSDWLASRLNQARDTLLA
jgi:DnaJ family protein C protein 19